MSVYPENYLSGKSTFIAGGTSGINLGIAKLFAQLGAHVCVMSRSQDKVDAAVAEIAAQNSDISVKGFSADVRDYDAVSEALKVGAEAHGEFDIVISGAAGNFMAPASAMSANAFKTVIDIDLLGTFNVLRAAFEVSKQPGASFINISAPQGAQPFFGQAHVCSAKAGIDMLTKCLASEWGVSGVRVNAIVPGPIEGTEGMARLAPTPEARKFVEMSVPMRRYGSTEEIGNMAVFLGSEAAAYVTGCIHYCDGGQTLSGGGALNPALLMEMTSKK
ncbi:SDR family oxidoreductase [Alterisphingorhabdus coralli]|uniref:SDR family oxidoreductase n=1 Tax=Alterisphingorhabdus coralli TaxID=3071408 RepID=A0AA97F7S5_9SPHN|nr:SDR family oxidoreductase [Parasphingorhabdus sp. SCSIO 66989]WOE75496.1 SDR family oxidoreductase [Parasphingorhabdus sp. SCSIO 66989]